MIVLGIHPGHDATASLIQDGRLVAAIAEERLSRHKYHMGFPYRAAAEVLRIAKVKPAEVDAMAISFLFYGELPGYFRSITFDPKGGNVDYSNEIKSPFLRARILAGKIEAMILPKAWLRQRRKEATMKELRFTADLLGLANADIVLQDHHLAHVASSYYAYGESECLAFTVDGYGDGLSATVVECNGGRFKRIAEVDERDSPGTFYGAITKYLGFKRNRHEGKITGLAAYGDPTKLAPRLGEAFTCSEDDSSFVVKLPKSLALAELPRMALGILRGDWYPSLMTNRWLDYLRVALAGSKQEDVAAAAQHLLEDRVVAFVQHWVQETGRRKLALSGGVFANVRLNQKVLEQSGAEEIFIYPNMGDGGTAAGAAWLTYAGLARKAKLEEPTPQRISDVYLGAGYEPEEVERALKKSEYSYTRPNNLAAEVAKRLHEGKVVGLFCGRMEYGPRALGARTIMASATDAKINDWLNQRLGRSEFMPFAPVVLAERADDLFENCKGGELASRFMTLTFDMKKEWIEKAPAVAHVDGTARPQLIDRDTNPLYYDILKAYEALSGLPLCINTSFNMHEEPIVASPEDALRAFKLGRMSCLVLDPFLIDA